MEMGFAETKDSWRGRPPFWSYAEALMIADVLESSTPVLNLAVPDLVPWEDGDDEAFRDGVAISIGDVVVIVSSAKDGAHGDSKQIWVKIEYIYFVVARVEVGKTINSTATGSNTFVGNLPGAFDYAIWINKSERAGWYFSGYRIKYTGAEW
jgi:hypothetical protein